MKVSLPGQGRILSLTEVEVFANVNGVLENVALASKGAVASQSSTYIAVPSVPFRYTHFF